MDCEEAISVEQWIIPDDTVTMDTCRNLGFQIFSTENIQIEHLTFDSMKGRPT